MHLNFQNIVNRSNLLYFFLIISFLLPISLQVFQLPQIVLIYHCLVFFAAMVLVRTKTKYSKEFYFFSFFWGIIIFLHFLLKYSIDVFGYMQYYFYAFCFYIILKNFRNTLHTKDLFNLIKGVYLFLFVSLFIEFILNIFGYDFTFADLFSNKSIGKNYQLLPSRILMATTGLNISALNSIFFGPQSASMLLFLILLFFNPYDKIHKPKSKVLFITTFILFIVSNTMTVNLIMLIFLLYFTFFSKNSHFNNFFFKGTLVVLISFFGSFLFSIFFSVLMDDAVLNLYLFKWVQPISDVFLLSNKQLFFGIGLEDSIENYTESWEFGFLQVVFLSGILPILFFTIITIYLIKTLFYFRKFQHLFPSHYGVARFTVFVVIVSYLSLFHYAAIFSTGFFQLLGFHISISLFCFDQMSQVLKSLSKI